MFEFFKKLKFIFKKQLMQAFRNHGQQKKKRKKKVGTNI